MLAKLERRRSTTGIYTIRCSDIILVTITGRVHATQSFLSRLFFITKMKFIARCIRYESLLTRLRTRVSALFRDKKCSRFGEEKRHLRECMKPSGDWLQPASAVLEVVEDNGSSNSALSKRGFWDSPTPARARHYYDRDALPFHSCLFRVARFFGQLRYTVEGRNG